MKSVNALCEKIRRVGERDSAPNSRGNTIHRLNCDSERYLVDFADNFTAEGWQQFDTDQDAHYFGAWVNPRTRTTLSYAEGDWTLCDCPTAESYRAEIEDMIRYYGEGYEAKTLDTETGEMVVYRQDRQKFLATA